MSYTQADKDAIVADAQAFLDACKATVVDAGPPPPPPPPPPTVIAVGGRVKVIAQAKVRMNPDPNEQPGLGVQAVGAGGTVTGALTNGFWLVAWDLQPSGWTWAANIAVGP